MRPTSDAQRPLAVCVATVTLDRRRVWTVRRGPYLIGDVRAGDVAALARLLATVGESLNDVASCDGRPL